MAELAYLFERFPSFTQTFCYREIAELIRQGVSPEIFSIRRAADEPPQPWDVAITGRVRHLPGEDELVRDVARLIRKRKLPPDAVQAIEEWGRRSDFLRLHQAAYVGTQLREAGGRHVHAHFAGLAARTAYWVSRFFGVTFSFTAHANDIFAARPFAIGLAELIATARLVVTVSDYGVRFLRERFPEQAAKIHRVYNGIDVSRFDPASLAAGVPSIVSVGRLIEKKGFADLIQACAELKSRGRDFRCEIIGEGPLESDLGAEIVRLQLEDRVSLVGPLPAPEVACRLAAATVFALPCVIDADGGMDNLPTVIMEAMASGLPVVSTPIAGVPEMVHDADNGSLVPPRNPPALADAIDGFISDLARARQFGRRGRALAEEKFAIEPNVRSLRSLLATATEAAAET